MVIHSLAQRKKVLEMRRFNNTHRQANMLRRYFAPSSVLPPPNMQGSNYGNRNTTGTAQNSQNTPPVSVQQVQFKNGKAVVQFGVKFNSPPVVTATAITANTNGPQEITLAGLASSRNAGGGVSACVLQSSDPTDSRLLNVKAVGNPN